ncbi:MAG TPA: hypothetical protein VGJ60_34530 [Chloroflexota bacterium]
MRSTGRRPIGVGVIGVGQMGAFHGANLAQEQVVATQVVQIQRAAAADDRRRVDGSRLMGVADPQPGLARV